MELSSSATDASEKEEVGQSPARLRVEEAVVHPRTLKTLLGLSAKTTRPLGDGTSIRRLGKAELGPNAFEERMPTRLRMQLKSGSTRNKEGPTALIEVLARLCDQDQSVETVYLCHAAVRRLSKTKNEGNLCGYRNIQMMISYIIGAPAPGSEHFLNGLPSVLDLQDLIEEAWDKGINSEGRVETGGVRGTRKYIGTPEAQALLRGLDIGCRAGAYNDTEHRSSAWESLLEFAKVYFSSSASPNASTPCKIHQTNLPPIYLQRPNHSLTIVGFETRTDGTSDLLVFDPAFGLSRAMEKALRRSENGTVFESKSKQARKLLDPFRRGRRHLKRYQKFETLTLTAPSCQR